MPRESSSSQVSNWGQPINDLPRQPLYTGTAILFGVPNVQSKAAGGATAWNSIVADRGALFFFAVTAPITITDLACRVTVSAVGGELRAGIYRCKSDNTPGELVADFGVISASSTGKKEINALSTVLGPGFYYSYLVANATVTVEVSSGSTPYWSHFQPTSNNPVSYFINIQTYGALPATLSSSITTVVSANGIGCGVMYKFV